MDANRLQWGVAGVVLGFVCGFAVEMRRTRKYQKQALQARAAAESASNNTTHLMESMMPPSEKTP